VNLRSKISSDAQLSNRIMAVTQQKLSEFIGTEGYYSHPNFPDFRYTDGIQYLVKNGLPWLPSSKRCSSCGHIVEKMPLNVRKWDCPQCGTHHDRDINASINILAAGLAVSVCGATVRRSLRSSRSLHPRERRPEQSKSVKAGAKNSSRKRKKQKPK
jgi:hypothetical protein